MQKSKPLFEDVHPVALHISSNSLHIHCKYMDPWDYASYGQLFRFTLESVKNSIK